MRTSALLAVLTIPLAFACGQGSGSFDQAQKDALAVEIRETLIGLTEAMNSHDPEELFKYYRNSEEFLFLGCTDFMLGWSAFSPRVESYYAQKTDVVFNQEVVRIQLLSPTVAAVALRGGSTDSEALFWTEVLVKEGGGWVIAHEHQSWPGCSPPAAAHPFTTMEEMTEIGVADTIGLEGGGGR